MLNHTSVRTRTLAPRFPEAHRSEAGAQAHAPNAHRPGTRQLRCCDPVSLRVHPPAATANRIVCTEGENHFVHPLYLRVSPDDQRAAWAGGWSCTIWHKHVAA